MHFAIVNVTIGKAEHRWHQYSFDKEGDLCQGKRHLLGIKKLLVVRGNLLKKSPIF